MPSLPPRALRSLRPFFFPDHPLLKHFTHTLRAIICREKPQSRRVLRVNWSFSRGRVERDLEQDSWRCCPGHPISGDRLHNSLGTSIVHPGVGIHVVLVMSGLSCVVQVLARRGDVRAHAAGASEEGGERDASGRVVPGHSCPRRDHQHADLEALGLQQLDASRVRRRLTPLPHVKLSVDLHARHDFQESLARGVIDPIRPARGSPVNSAVEPLVALLYRVLCLRDELFVDTKGRGWGLVRSGVGRGGNRGGLGVKNRWCGSLCSSDHSLVSLGQKAGDVDARSTG
mmetsp:Transcript_20469/g.28573  ORF Transcript_20469/g.28573 Transcript_20469/m.28573 type:complete len:286 (+) Transcript_20469:1307-2164(+)